MRVRGAALPYILILAAVVHVILIAYQQFVLLREVKLGEIEASISFIQRHMDAATLVTAKEANAYGDVECELYAKVASSSISECDSTWYYPWGLYRVLGIKSRNKTDCLTTQRLLPLEGVPQNWGEAHFYGSSQNIEL